MDLKFDELPNPRRVWVGMPGSHEEGIGRLVLLTEENVREAASEEICLGRRVGLNWELTKMEQPSFGRKECEHSIVSILDGACFDDVYHFNPQQSSQWDGLRHFGQPSISKSPFCSGSQLEGRRDRVFYGGTTEDEILDRSNSRIGIHHWAREGITGRGVLIDYASWADKKHIKYSAFSQHSIKLSDVLAIASENNVVFKKGDILLIRSGFTREWDKMSPDAKKAYAASLLPKHAGLEASMEVLRWIWDAGFAAVAGDAVSFEVFPPLGQFTLHEYLIAGWGMPIGEMFDLERLAEVCKELGRSTFFFTSMPLNMPGGVSSPPNAQAIF
ncbi:hypothetical protein BKA67DRAFT_508869 [Truncatella angustata]|uniref:Cyclase n=1 Tax=Truncatella angustata TaxID=152316 RepID=A0A9P8UZS3_9PEZI|nr:uncharacterized protein BKA67DRAFT_508869 [Truncatella angustata]KAH6661163.1 hypothetical protein BKA67DRAFT_508869 [Truncatella angustata]